MKRAFLIISALLITTVLAAKTELPTKWEEHWFGPAENPAENSYISLDKIPAIFAADLDSKKPPFLQLVVYKSGLVSIRVDASFPRLASHGSQKDQKLIKWKVSDREGKAKLSSRFSVSEIEMDQENSRQFLEFLKRGGIISCKLTNFTFFQGHNYGSLKFKIDAGKFNEAWEKNFAPI